MNDRFPQYFWGTLLLALATFLGAFVIAGALRDFRSSSETLTVTGSARRPIRSDFVVWRGSVSAQQPDIQQAYQELRRYTEQVRTYLRKNQIPDSALTFPAIDNEQIQEWLSSGQPSGRIAAYRLTQRFEVRSFDVERIAAVSQKSSELISDGVPIMSFQPEFLFTKLADLRIEMLAEATRDARLRAETIAEAAGAEIEILRSARMGVFQVTSRNSTEVSDYGIYDTSSPDKDITAVVSLSFELD